MQLGQQISMWYVVNRPVPGATIHTTQRALLQIRTTTPLHPPPLRASSLGIHLLLYTQDKKKAWGGGGHTYSVEKLVTEEESSEPDCLSDPPPHTP